MSKPRQQGPHGIPEFIDLLSPNDRKLYDDLQQNVGSPDYRYNRNRRISTLLDIFDYIRDYCEYDKNDQWKRYLVCGICWFQDCIAINTRQLKLLISKSKSAINGAFVKMGYQTVPTKGEERLMLLEKIPFLSSRYSDLRQWTIRKLDPLLIKKRMNTSNLLNSNDIEDILPTENETKKEIENNKSNWKYANDDLDIFDDDPFQDYDCFEKCNKDPSEKELEFNFVNFGNDNYNSNYDFDFDFMNSNVFTLYVNQDNNINLSAINESIKNSRYDKNEYNMKNLKYYIDNNQF